MVTQFKKALYISTSILLTNVFILNSNAETNTATDIMSGIANIANSISTTINQQENNLSEEQTVSPQKTDVNTTTSEQNQENAASEAEDSTTKQTTDNTDTTIADQNTIPNSNDVENASITKIGFIDQNGNILIAPKETVFPAEMKEGELYYFSRDLDKAKENIKNNIIPNENGQQPTPSVSPTNSNVVAPGQLPQNPIYQPQNPTISNENGQQPTPSVSPTNSNVVAPGQLPQNPIYQPQPTIPNENGQQPTPSVSPTNSNVVDPGQLPQQNPTSHPTKNLEGGTNFDLDKTGKKPIMFQCYLA